VLFPLWASPLRPLYTHTHSSTDKAARMFSSSISAAFPLNLHTAALTKQHGCSQVHTHRCYTIPYISLSHTHTDVIPYLAIRSYTHTHTNTHTHTDVIPYLASRSNTHTHTHTHTQTHTNTHTDVIPYLTTRSYTHTHTHRCHTIPCISLIQAAQQQRCTLYEHPCSVPSTRTHSSTDKVTPTKDACSLLALCFILLV
jgi:hypothetical protein